MTVDQFLEKWTYPNCVLKRREQMKADLEEMIQDAVNKNMFDIMKPLSRAQITEIVKHFPIESILAKEDGR